MTWAVLIIYVALLKVNVQVNASLSISVRILFKESFSTICLSLQIVVMVSRLKADCYFSFSSLRSRDLVRAFKPFPQSRLAFVSLVKRFSDFLYLPSAIKTSALFIFLSSFSLLGNGWRKGISK